MKSNLARNHFLNPEYLKKFEKEIASKPESLVKDKDSIEYYNRKYAKDNNMVIPGSFYKVRD